ncbi:MAG: ADP-ribosylation factor-like protein [Candidatus Hodarchaeales archaeon]|jgi:small GTP-binding protein
MKLGFLGLDGAGKTSLLLALGKKFSAVSNLKATKGIERDSVDILGLEVNLWDFGGQQAYRERYLSKSKDLQGLDVIFFVIDAQNRKRIDESLDYLKNILESAKDFDKEHLIVCIHKADPDVQTKDAFGETVDKIQDDTEKLAPEAYAFPWTSIFDEHSIFSAFSMGLRMITSRKELAEKWMQKAVDDTNSVFGALLGRVPPMSFVIATKTDDPSLGDICEKAALEMVGMDQNLRKTPLASEAIVGRLKQGTYVLKPELIDKKMFYVMLFSQEANSADEILGKAKDSLSHLPGLLTTLRI